MRPAATSTLPTVSNIFKKIDANSDGVLSKDEIATLVKNAGVGAGDFFFGGLKRSKTVDQLMAFDTNKNGTLEMTEIAQALAKLFGGSTGGAPAPGSITQQALGWFAKADAAGDGHVTHDEAASFIQQQLQQQNPNDGNTGVEADIAADLLVYNLDTAGAGYVTKDEMQSIGQSIDGLVDAPATPKK